MEAAEDKRCQQMTVAEDNEPRKSDTNEDGRRTTIFIGYPYPDISALVTLLHCTGFGGLCLCPCTSDCEGEWKHQVITSSVIVLCLSAGTPHPDLSDVLEFLEYCKEKQNPENIKVVVMEVEDIKSERNITDWWMAGGYSDFELLTLSRDEINVLTKHKINPLSAERRMANKVRHMHYILQEASERSHIQKWQFVGRIPPSSMFYELGTTSTSTKSDHSWITELLLSDHFKDHFSEFSNDSVSNTKRPKLSSESCSFGMFYYTNKKGQAGEIDATDVQQIQEHSSVGMNNMIIVMDDVEDSSDHQKIRIIRHQPLMEGLCHNLFLISHQENSSNYQELLSSLLRNKKSQQPAKVAAAKSVNVSGDMARAQVDEVAMSAEDYDGKEKSAVLSNLSARFSIRKIPVNFPLFPRVVGIFSRSSKDEYSWLKEIIQPKFTEVKCFHISNNRFQQFMEEVSQCRFGILYHSKNRGRINVTDVTNSLYDDELEYMSTKLGKEKVWVVIDDLDDISDKAKEQILRSQPKIHNLAKDLYLIKHGTPEKKLRDLEHKTHLFT